MKNQSDLIVTIVAVLCMLIGVGVCFGTKKEAVRPAPPEKIVSTPLQMPAADVVMATSLGGNNQGAGGGGGGRAGMGGGRAGFGGQMGGGGGRAGAPGPSGPPGPGGPPGGFPGPATPGGPGRPGGGGPMAEGASPAG